MSGNAATRRFWLRIHRWSGLLLGALIVIAGLSGAVLAFQEELDVWLNRKLPIGTVVVGRLPTSALIAAAHRHYPALRVTRIVPGAPADEAVLVTLKPRPGLSGPFPDIDQAWLNPYSGMVMGERRWGAVQFDREHLVPLIYRLHYSLLVDEAGEILLGATSLIWLVSTGAAVWLAWPRRGKWKQALGIKLSAGNMRIVYDLHRSLGLIIAPALVLIAFTGAYFNLDFIAEPLQQKIAPTTPWPGAALPLQPMPNAPIAPEQALTIAQARFADSQPLRLVLDHAHAAYRIDLRRPSDFGYTPETVVFLSMEDGRELAVVAPETASAGDRFRSWLFPLHTGQFLGLAGQILWCFAGLATLVFLWSGVTIWIKKNAVSALRGNRMSSRRHPARQAHRTPR